MPGAARRCGDSGPGGHLSKEVVAPLLHLGGQRRASAAQHADRRQIAAGRRGDPGLHAVAVERGASAEEGHALLGCHAPQHCPVGPLLAAAGVAVVQHAGGAAQQAADLGVPHDPAGGAVPVVALAQGVGRVAAADVVVQHRQLQHHQHHAAMAVHDGLGQAGGAAGIGDPQRVVERQPRRFKGRSLCIISGDDACVASGISYCF